MSSTGHTIREQLEYLRRLQIRESTWRAMQSKGFLHPGKWFDCNGLQQHERRGR